jgi:hypothetical protein
MSNNKKIHKINLNVAGDVWSSLLVLNDPMPIYSFEWYSAWINAHKEEWDPYIVYVGNETLAPFVKKGDVISFTHGFTDFNDILGNKAEWPIILEYLRHDGITKLDLHQIPQDSETVVFFTKYVAKYPKKASIAITNSAPYILLPKTFDEYLGSIKEKRKKYVPSELLALKCIAKGEMYSEYDYRDYIEKQKKLVTKSSRTETKEPLSKI